MFCKFCGKSIDDDSVFCSYCGKKLIKESTITDSISKIESNEEVDTTTKIKSNEETDTSQENDIENSNPDKKFLSFLLLGFVIFVFIAGLLFYLSTSGCSEDKGITTRDITSNDYSLSAYQEAASYRITITPRVDIDTCNVELNIYDDNGKRIYANTLTKSNLKEDSSYSFSFDYGLNTAFSGDKIRYKVTGTCSKFD